MTNSAIQLKERRSTINFQDNISDTLRNYQEAKANYATFDLIFLRLRR